MIRLFARHDEPLGEECLPEAVPCVQRLFYRGWTEAENAEVAMLWRANYTASQIAARLGRSRGSVMGKIDRLGLIRSRAKRRGQIL